MPSPDTKTRPPLELTHQDLRTMFLISALTVGSLVVILTLPVVTSYQIRARDVVMVIGWFFGATMTFAWIKRGSRRS